MRIRSQNGQILAEIIIAIAIIGVIGAVIATVFLTSLRSSESGQKRGQATALALESLQALRAITSTDYDSAGTIDSGWLHVYCPRANGATTVPTCASTGTKGPAGTGHIYRTVLTGDNCATSGSGSWDLCNSNAAESITLGSETFTRSLYLENVCRSTAGAITGVTPCGGSDKEDIGTQKATIQVASTNVRTVTLETYLARWQPTNAAAQALWSGAQSAGPVTSFTDTYDTCAGIKRNTPTGSLSLNTTTACVNP